MDTPASTLTAPAVGATPVTPLTIMNTLYETELSPGGSLPQANLAFEAVEYFDLNPSAPPPPTSTLPTAVQRTNNMLSAAASAASERPEEFEFSEIVSGLMKGEVDPPTGVQEFEAVCMQRAADLRDAAAGQLQAGARYMRLQEMALELELEAATWSLVYHLYGNRSCQFPGGVGGQSTGGVGPARTYQQQLSDLLAADDLLNRVARVVSWLETLAANKMDREERNTGGGGLANRFSSEEGVWRETKSRIQAAASRRGAADNIVSELDPDAPTRQAKGLDSYNAQDEERLMAYLWKLIRAGKLDAARQLCVDVGQPWRAVSLGGGGDFGPVPVGRAAALRDEEGSAGDQEMALEAEVCQGFGLQRNMWLWSMYQAAQQIGSSSQALGKTSNAALYESAVYGSLCGHLSAMLCVASTWEDAAWAYLRAWLDLSVAINLPAQQPTDTVALDLLMSSLSSSCQPNVVQQGGSVLQGNWPLSSLQDTVPSTLTEVFATLAATTAGGAAAGDAVRQDALSPYRLVQADIILEELESLVCKHLLPWVTQVSGKGTRRGQGHNPGAAPTSPMYSASLMRFAAHLSICLQALEVVTPPQDPKPAQYDVLHDALFRLIQAYVIHLIDTRQYNMIPMYCCHLRPGLRQLTYAILLEELTQEPMESCKQAFELASHWFSFWQYNDMSPQEMSIIVDRVARQSRQKTTGGPRVRGQNARWVCFDASMRAYAVDHINTLCREFALDGLAGAVSMWELLYDVVPGALDGGLDELTADHVERNASAMQELSCWADYAELCRLCEEWSAFFDRLVTQRSTRLTPEEEEHVRDNTLPLLKSIISFLQEGTLDAILGDAARAQAPCRVTLILAPMPCAQHSSEVQDGFEYNRLAAEEAPEFAALVVAALTAALQVSNLQPKDVQVEVTPGEHEFAGFVKMQLFCDSSDSVVAAVHLLADLLKGELEVDGQRMGEMQVLNWDSPAFVQGSVLRKVLYPVLLLRAATLREALMRVGGDDTLGHQLVPLLAGADGLNQYNGLSFFFSQSELQAFIQVERQCVLHGLEAKAGHAQEM